MSELNRAIASFCMPSKRILFLHVRLRNLKELLNVSYEECAEILLKAFDQLSPSAIVIPTFTESFTRTGVHHSLFSKSESGRFSEDVRKNYNFFRLLEPMHSVICSTDLLERNIDCIDCSVAFGEKSLYAYLHNEDAYIFNFDLPEIVSTQFHYIEVINKVPYRYLKKFSGVIYYDTKNYREIEYLYHVRDLQMNPLIDRERVRQFLIESGTLKTTMVGALKTDCFSAKQLMESLTPEIQKNPYFMVRINEE